MKLNLSLLYIGLLTGMASIAQAEGLYVGAQAGLSMSSKDNVFNSTATVEGHPNTITKSSYRTTNKSGYSLISTIGYDLDFNMFGSIRPELELGYRYNSSDKAKNLSIISDVDTDINSKIDKFCEKILHYKNVEDKKNNESIILNALQQIPSELLQAQIRAAIAADSGITSEMSVAGGSGIINILTSILNGAPAKDISAWNVGNNIISGRTGLPNKPEEISKQKEAVKERIIEGISRADLLGGMLARFPIEAIDAIPKEGLLEGAKEIEMAGSNLHQLRLAMQISSAITNATAIEAAGIDGKYAAMQGILVGANANQINKIIETGVINSKEYALAQTKTVATAPLPTVVDAINLLALGATREKLKTASSNDIIAALISGYDKSGIEALPAKGDGPPTVKARMLLSESEQNNLITTDSPITKEEFYIYKPIPNIDNIDYKDSGGLGVTSGMFNVIYDIPTGFFIRPFFGVGAGIAHISDKMKTEILGEHRLNINSMAYQGIAGISIHLTPTIRINADYRYLSTTKKVLSGKPLSRTLNYIITTNNNKDIDTAKNNKRMTPNFIEGVHSSKKLYTSKIVMLGLSYSFGVNRKR